MKGLVIWALSDCRSLMGLFSEIQKQANCPVVIVLLESRQNEGLRQKIGFRHEEFSDLDIVEINGDLSRGKEVLELHLNYNHLFTVYQSDKVTRQLIDYVIEKRVRFGVISEAPCVMINGLKGWLKRRVYLNFYVPYRIKKIVRNADFIVNLSGDSTMDLRKIGWPMSKIIPFGYFSDPLPNARLICRGEQDEFFILVTGLLTWHRAPDIILKAFTLLKLWGVKFRSVFTQDGPLLNDLKQFVKNYDLPVEFCGLMPIQDLVKLYESCSLFIGAGRSEPWGMRLNDALQCGAPIVVSRGMGGVQLVDEYGCGVSFASDDYVDLAWKLRRLIYDKNYYLKLSRNAHAAALMTRPSKKAGEFISTIEKNFDGWNFS